MNIDDQVWKQVQDQVLGQALRQVWDLVSNQVRYQVWNQVSDKVRNQIRNQVLDEILKIRAETWHLLYEIKTSKKVVDNVTNLVYNASMINKEKESSQ